MTLTKEDLSAISEMMKPMFGKMDDRLDKMDERFGKMDGRLDKMDERFGKMDDQLDVLKFNQGCMMEKLKGLEVTMNYNDYHLSHDIKKLQEDVSTIAEILKIHDMLPIAQ